MAAPAPNTPMVAQQLLDLVNLANAKLPYGPYLVLEVAPAFQINNRGAFDPTKNYAAGDMVLFGSPATGFAYWFVTLFAIPAGTTGPLGPDGKPDLRWYQPWYSCYQRIRDDAGQSANLNGRLATFQQSVSGPWPITAPNIQYDRLAFYYPDTGKQESVTVEGNGPLMQCFAVRYGFADGPSNLFFDNPNTTGFALWHSTFEELVSDTTNGGTQPGQVITQAIAPAPDPNDGTGTWKSRIVNSATFEVDVGGTVPVPVNATLTVGVTAIRGIILSKSGDGMLDGGIEFADNVYEDTDPSGLVVVDDSGWIPGAQLQSIVSPWGNLHVNGGPFGGGTDLPILGGVTYKWTINGMVPPGKYRVTLSTGSVPNVTAQGQITDNFQIFPDLSQHNTYTGTESWTNKTYASITPFMSGSGTIDFLFNQSVEVPGVHDTAKCLKIPVAGFSGQGFPTGLLCTFGYYHFDMFGNDQTASEAGGGLPDGSAGPFDLPRNLWNNPPPTDPGFLFIRYVDPFGWTITPSTLGYWFGKTPPIQGLGILPYERMPWNQFPTDPTGKFPQLNKALGYTAPYTGGIGTGQNGALAYDVFDAPNWLAATSNNEMLPWPKKWKGGVVYPANFVILDKNGNLQRANGGRSGNAEPNWQLKQGQSTADANGLIWFLFKQLRPLPNDGRKQNYKAGDTAIDTNGNTQQVTTAGTTGAGEPAWATKVGNMTNDGTVVWKCTRLNAKFNPAVARITPPIYPNYKSTQAPPVLRQGYLDTTGNPIWDFGFTLGVAGTKTAGGTTYGQGNLPALYAGPNWWIYRVALNRIPQTKSRTKPPTDPIPVTIGCIRNGAFVAFGTYNTGQIIDAMWPVFIPEALIYQAAEMVDIQAEFITCGSNYGMWGTVSYPMAAAHLNDVTAILNQL